MNDNSQLGKALRRYHKPGPFVRSIMNPLVTVLVRVGVSVLGSRELRVRGRVSGEWRSTPVNLLAHAGARYLVSPRGETQWVRNARFSGGGELRLGQRIEVVALAEVADVDKVDVLRAYLRRWGSRSACSSTASDRTRPTSSCARSRVGLPCSGSRRRSHDGSTGGRPDRRASWVGRPHGHRCPLRPVSGGAALPRRVDRARRRSHGLHGMGRVAPVRHDRFHRVTARPDGTPRSPFLACRPAGRFEPTQAVMFAAGLLLLLALGTVLANVSRPGVVIC